MTGTAEMGDGAPGHRAGHLAGELVRGGAVPPRLARASRLGGLLRGVTGVRHRRDRREMRMPRPTPGLLTPVRAGVADAGAGVAGIAGVGGPDGVGAAAAPAAGRRGGHRRNRRAAAGDPVCGHRQRRSRRIAARGARAESASAAGTRAPSASSTSGARAAGAGRRPPRPTQRLEPKPMTDAHTGSSRAASTVIPGP